VTKDPSIDDIVLQPIPRMRDIAIDVVRKGLAAGDLAAGKVAAIDVGVMCNAGGVNTLARTIHTQVLDQLKY